MSNISSTFIFRKDDNIVPLWQFCVTKHGNFEITSDKEQISTLDDLDQIIGLIDAAKVFFESRKLKNK